MKYKHNIKHEIMYWLNWLLVITIIIFIFCSCTVAKPLKVTVEHIEKTEAGIEVWVKHHDPHYYYRSYHLVKTFDTLPPDIKRGNVIFLQPSKDSAAFQWVFRK